MDHMCVCVCVCVCAPVCELKSSSKLFLNGLSLHFSTTG